MTKQQNCRDRGGRFAILLGTNLAVLVLLLLLTEAVLRIAGIPYKESFIPSENAVARFDDALGWSYIPNLSKEVQYGPNSRMLYTDGNGIRVPSSGYTLSAERPSVLFIGCSFTMGHGLSYEDSFPGQFEALTHGRYQSVNLGVQAYGTDQAFLTLKRYAPRFNAKVVVYTFIEEHIYRNGNYDRRYLYPAARLISTKPLFALNRSNEPYLSKQPLLYRDYKYRHSYLYDLIMMKIEKHPPYPEALTRALVLEMKRYCEERGIRFVMINWRWRERDYNNFDGLQVNIIDTMDRAPAGWEGMLIPDEDHPNAEASRHVAYLLHRFFEKEASVRPQY